LSPYFKIKRFIGTSGNAVKIQIIITMIAYLLLAVGLPLPVLANPAFSRQTGASCRQCHFQGMHSLNKYGREFLENGFRETKKMKAYRRKIEKKHHKRKHFVEP